MRVKITWRCNECKQRNYNTMKNKKNNPDRLEMNKYCPFCRKHTVHTETKYLEGETAMAEEKKVKKDHGKWFREMRSELMKVVWPSAKTTAKNTGTVLLCSLGVGACIWIFDGVAVLAVKTLIGLFTH